MPALVLSLTGALVLGGILWVVVGTRIKFAKDSTQNDILNFLVYFVVAFAIMFPVVIFVIA